MLDNRNIRVFISSTFRDMMRERDLLVKQVFPNLRRLCAKRFVTFTEVDLRWGITEEQASEGQVLPLCLAEIERSRPFFIGLLGERYGWVPDTIRPEVIGREPWLKEHLEGHTSVIELEILHGVLNNPKMRRHAFFYFRDPAYENDPSLGEDDRRELVERNIKAEAEKYGEEEAARRTEQRKAKLAALKERIRKSGLPMVEPYANPEVLAKIIEEQFTALIDQLYPKTATPDSLAQERTQHEAHARNKLFACIDRPPHAEALTEFSELADHDGKGLVVTGESGSGKTALLAAWAQCWRRDNPDDFLFQHYFGATPESSLPNSFLRRLLGELKARFGIDEEIPSDSDKLREALLFWLARIPHEVQVLLVLDGLDQLRGSEPDGRLGFLPHQFPAHVTVMASALPGPALEALRGRGWVEHHLPQAPLEEVDAMAAEYFRIHGRLIDAQGHPLDTPLRRQLASAPGCGNPLYLRTILEELRQFGDFERLPAQVAKYLKAETPKELFLAVLKRWQQDFDSRSTNAENFDLTRRALTHLWTAREGLSESEWLDLLGMDRNPTSDADPLPRAFWTPLFLALEPHLSQRSGLFAFGHDFLRQAVEKAYISTPELQKSAHLALVDYFERHQHQKQMTPRKAAEWPFQLHAAEAWDRLEACLTDIPLFLNLFNNRTKWELTGYWLPLREKGIDMGNSYIEAFHQYLLIPQSHPYYTVAGEMGHFLLDNGLFSPAKSLLCFAVEESERALGADHSETLTNVHDLAATLSLSGEHDEALALYRRVVEERKRILGLENMATQLSINNLAEVLQNMGIFDEAHTLFQQSLEISEKIFGSNHPHTLVALDNLAGILVSKSKDDEVQPLIERALAGAMQVLGPAHPDTLIIMGNLVEVLRRAGKYGAAQPILEELVESEERVLGPEHPQTLKSISQLAGLLRFTGQLPDAEILLQKAQKMTEKVFGAGHPETFSVLNELGSLMEAKGDHEQAQRLYKEAFEQSRDLLGRSHPQTLKNADNLGVIYVRQHNYALAQPLLEYAYEERKRVLGPNHSDTDASRNNLGFLMQAKAEFKMAEQLFEGSLRISEDILGPDHPETLVRANNLGRALSKQGEHSEAEPLCRRALKGFIRLSQMNGHEHPRFTEILANYFETLCETGLSKTEAIAQCNEIISASNAEFESRAKNEISMQ